jgi:transcriptional regulator with GAF, ATPase, and Fis domain
VLALAIAAAEQRGQLERTLGREREASRLLAARTVGDRPGVLEDSASPTVRELAARARQVAVTDTPVLLLGDTGTGKERLARAIHGWSRRASGPFVAINCAAIPATLIESELFGHVRGAFSGATKDRSGRFRVADGGTLLLDEIGELPLELQAKLLRVLQEGTFEPVGSDRGVRADVRVIAATHVDLREAASAGRFRPDLLYRLDVFPLRLPPLRERLEDLPALVEVMLAEQSQRTGRVGLRVDGEGFARLRRHGWPGNLRELANVLERASILLPPGAPAVLDGAAIERAMPVLAALAGPLPGDDEPPPTLDEIQRRHILAVLRRTGGRLYGEGGAAELLGLRPSTLQSRMKKLGLARKAALAGG